MTNLKKIEDKEEKVEKVKQKRITRFLQASSGVEQRMTKEEYKAWRAEQLKKRFGLHSMPRWLGGTKVNKDGSL